MAAVSCSASCSGVVKAISTPGWPPVMVFSVVLGRMDIRVAPMKKTPVTTQAYRKRVWAWACFDGSAGRRRVSAVMRLMRTTQALTNMTVPNAAC